MHKAHSSSLHFQTEVERKRALPMNITSVIPDGYNGPIKQLTCRVFLPRQG